MHKVKLFNEIRRTGILIVIMALMATGSDATYFSGEINFAYDLPGTDSQTAPDLAFDQVGGSAESLHMVWSNFNGVSNHIYHQAITLDGIPTDSKVASSATPNLGNPTIMFGLTDPNHGYMISADGFTGDFFSAFLDMYEPPVFWWTPIDIVSTSSPVALDYSAATTSVFADSLWIAFADPTATRGLIFGKNTGAGWNLQTIVDASPLAEYHKPQICIDDLGYIYVVFQVIEGTPVGWFAMRSSTANPNPGMGMAFLDKRLITSSMGAEGCVCDVHGGLSETTDATFVTVWSENTGAGQIFSICEVDEQNPSPVTSLWQSSTPMGGVLGQVSGTGALDPVNPDVVLGWNRQINVIWEDDRNGPETTIYGSRSYNLGGQFLFDRQMSFPHPGESMYDPTIAADPIRGHLAVGYTRGAATTRVVGRLSTADHVNRCDASPSLAYWQNQAGITVNTTFFHDYTPNGSSYRVANGTNRGALAHDFSPNQVMGVVSLWFYDDPTLNLNEDFWVIFEGDDGSRAGIFRMLGVRNETSTSNFCFNPTGLEPDWQDSGISRGAAEAWHHVVIVVNEDGLQIYLDPETVTPAVIDDSSVATMLSIGVQGGSDAESYYIDDIHIAGILLPIIPAMSVTGMIFLLLFIPFYIRFRHFFLR